MIEAIGPAGSPPVAAAGQPQKARDAAQQFEALLLAQMLRSVRAGGEDDSVSELAQQQLALVLARRGGLGLADVIAKGLERR